MNSYIVGLLATDGHTSEYISKVGETSTYNCSIELKDYDVLEKISNIYEIPLHCRKRVIKNKERTMYTLYFKTSHAKDIGEYLINNKEKLYDYYSLQKDKNSFIRGLFDGDGSVCKNSSGNTLRLLFCINSNHSSILKILLEYFNENSIKYSIYLDKRGCKCYNVSVGSKQSVGKFFELMYSDNSKLWLNRKYDTFINNGFPKPVMV